MMRRWLLKWPIERAIVAACIFGLLSLVVMIVPVFVQKPILLVAGMSLGQFLGGAAFILFALSVTVDLIRARPRTRSMGQP